MLKKFVCLMDCNNFFASCERAFNGKLKGKPIAILSSNDGCVVSRSNEVKALGIPMGAPAFKWKIEFEKYKVIAFSSNFSLYGDMSKRVMCILESMVENFENYSIDEAFFELQGTCDEEVFTEAERIKKTLEQFTGISVSLGLAQSKTLAKVASKKAKENVRGVFMINEKNNNEVLSNFPVDDVWGFGRKLSVFLKDRNIFTVQDFINLPESWVKTNLGITGLLKQQDLKGTSIYTKKVETNQKSIVSTKSFGMRISSYEIVKDSLRYHTEIIARKLRMQKSVTTNLILFLHIACDEEDARFSRKEITKCLSLETPTNSTPLLLKKIFEGLDLTHREGFEYKKAGVGVSNLYSEENEQMSIFETPTMCLENEKKIKKIISVSDDLCEKYGDKKIGFGLNFKNKQWKVRQEKMSKRFTTHWDEFPVVNCK